jgi:hypothetical protein
MRENGHQNGHAAIQPHALLHEDTLVLQQFTETDPTVVRLVAGTGDTEAAVHSCLQVGARAIDLARVNLDTAMVESSFDSMVDRLGQQLADTVTSVHETTHALLDSEEGALTGALGKWLTDVEGALDDTFDEDSKKSAIGKLERVLDQARKEQVEAVRRIVDPHDEDGPLARQRREILKAFREETTAIKAAVAEVSEKIAVRKAESELLEHTAIKGVAYEDIVHAEVARIVEPYGDAAEQAGTTTGAAGTKKGDEIVTLNPEETRGQPTRYALEIKDRKVGLSAILAELDGAQVNRGALASIAVFSRESNCPAAGAFTYHGTRALAVLDKDEPDPGALRLACLWARWIARRQLSEDSELVDSERIEALIAEGSRALDRLVTIRRCHTAARNKIQEAGSQVDDLGTELDGILSRIRAEIER